MFGRSRSQLRTCWRAALVLGVLLLTACAGTSAPAGMLDTAASFEQSALDELPHPNAYRIGIHTEVTGSGAQIGDLSIRAARLAVEEINAAGGVDGTPLELVVRDCRSDVTMALQQYRESIAEDQLVALLGPVKSAYAVPMVREHVADTVPLFIGATNTTLTEQGDANLFQMRPSIRVTAAGMVALAAEQLGSQRAGVIFDADLHGSNGAERIAAELERRGIPLAAEASYATATSDYDPLARQMASADVETIFIYGTNPTDIGRLLRAIRYRDLDVTIITSPGGSSIITHNLAGDAQDNIYVAIDSLFSASEEGVRFESTFSRRFGLEPDTYVAWYYDAVYVIAEALRVRQGDTRDFSTAIREQAYQGAQGLYRFDARGEGLHEVALVTMQSGEPRLIGSYSQNGLDMVALANMPVVQP